MTKQIRIQFVLSSRFHRHKRAVTGGTDNTNIIINHASRISKLFLYLFVGHMCVLNFFQSFTMWAERYNGPVSQFSP